MRRPCCFLFLLVGFNNSIQIEKTAIDILHKFDRRLLVIMTRPYSVYFKVLRYSLALMPSCFLKVLAKCAVSA